MSLVGGALIISTMVTFAVALGVIGLEVMRQERQAMQRAEAVAASGELLAPSLELQAPFQERVLQPMLSRLLHLLARLSPAHNVDELQHNLVIAGSSLGPMDFVGLRVIFVVLGTLAVAGVLFLMLGPTLQAVLLTIVVALLFMQLPKFWLYGRMRKRRKAITLALPDALDMLTVCVDAGLGLEGAFQRIGQTWEHELAFEFRRAVVEMGMGISWREAMRHLVYRTDAPDLSSIVAVLLQAEQLGFSISDTLHTQADQLRVRRRQRAEEAARAAPFKMLFPMVFFIMPATFAVVLGPAIPALLEALGSAF